MKAIQFIGRASFYFYQYMKFQLKSSALFLVPKFKTKFFKLWLWCKKFELKSSSSKLDLNIGLSITAQIFLLKPTRYYNEVIFNAGYILGFYMVMLKICCCPKKMVLKEMLYQECKCNGIFRKFWFGKSLFNVMFKKFQFC